MKMNILFLCNSPHAGGAEIWVRRVALGLRERGHGVVVAAPSDGLIARTGRGLGIPLIPVEAGPVLNKRSALAFLWGWRRNRRRLLEVIDTARRVYDVGVVHVGLTAEKLLIGRLSPLPVVWTEHGPLPPLLIRSPLFRRYQRAGLAASLIHCVSHATASHLREIGFPRDHLRPIQLGLRADAGSSDRAAELRAALGFEANHVVVASVSRLVWTKGLDSFLIAASRLAASHPHVRFLAAGDGPLRADLERQSRQLGLNGRFLFTGHRSDVPDLFRAIDIHVAPSVEEGFGMTVLEAMRSGTPSVATEVGGHPELIVDGETGFLTPVGSPDALAKRLAQLASDPALRTSLGVAARERVERDFSHATFVDRMEKLFAEAASTPPPSRVPA